MERSLVAFDQNFSGAVGDFPVLLRRKGLLAPAAENPLPQAGTPQKIWQPTEATTILAFKFSGGVLVAGDRRATAGNTVVYDRAATGSGSPAVRGILFYENNWGAKPLQELGEDEAVSIALRALDTAAQSDTATGGVDRGGKIYPLIKIVSRDGITTLPESKIAAVFKETVA